jgi:hypothetical protein
MTTSTLDTRDAFRNAPRIRIGKKIQSQLHFTWGLNNSKLRALAESTGMSTLAFDIPAGFTCPAAYICQTYANRTTGKITQGKHSQFTCYAARNEGIYKNSRLAHWHNFDLIQETLKQEKGIESLAQMLSDDIRLLNPGIVRIHSSGDMFTSAYTLAWIRVAELNPDVIFFGYTKVYASYQMLDSVHYANLGFAFSLGSRDDRLVRDCDVTCTVIQDGSQFNDDSSLFYNAQFERWDKVICGNHHDAFLYSEDFHRIMNRESFGIPLH